MRTGRRPGRGVGGAEEQEAGDAAGGGEMADPGIVAEEKTALGEEGDEFAERTPVGGRAEGGEGGTMTERRDTLNTILLALLILAAWAVGK